jgi:hypothetical protein
MKRIKTFDNFVNEELSWKNAAIGLGMAAGLSMNPAKSQTSVEEPIVKNISYSKKIDLTTIENIFKKKGYNFEKTDGYKLWGHKETSGPIQNKKTGEYAWNYEIYIPSHDLLAKTYTEVRGEQLWVDKRRMINADNVESENIIIGLTGPNHQVVIKKNGKIIDTQSLTTQEVINLLNEYGVGFYR